MALLPISFLAGVLTVLAPCSLTLLPVILTGSVGKKSLLRPLIITGSLAASIIIFTLLLKVTAFLLKYLLDFGKFSQEQS